MTEARARTRARLVGRKHALTPAEIEDMARVLYARARDLWLERALPDEDPAV
jgi:hypothetical protein